MNEEIKQKLENLIETLEAQEEVRRFIEIERKMHQNVTLKQRINEYKKWQQRVVLNEYRTGETDEHAEAKLRQLYEELADIPIFNEYLHLMEEINEVIQSITKIIEESINQ